MAHDHTSAAAFLGLRHRVRLVALYLVALSVLGGGVLALLLAPFLPAQGAQIALGALPVAVVVVALRGLRHVRRVYTAIGARLDSAENFFEHWRHHQHGDEDAEKSRALKHIDGLGAALRVKVLGVPAARPDRVEAVLEEARAAVRTGGEEPPAFQEMRKAVRNWHDTLA